MSESRKMTQNNFHDLQRQDFRNRLDHFLHPSGNVSIPDQLKGRLEPMRQMEDCFETRGAQAFIWGPRGVGKTSLGHTACHEHGHLVEMVAAVACGKDTTFSQLMNDIFIKVVHSNKIDIKSRSIQASYEAFGFSFNGSTPSLAKEVKIENINSASAFLNTIFSYAAFPSKIPVVIVDEFDLLENPDTLVSLSNLLKQISVDDVRVKFIFCGVARNLEGLLGAHESVERYVYGVELPPLSFEAIREIITDIESEFDVYFHRGQQIRIAQISSGYAGFTHLILKNILLAMFENRITENQVPDEIYKLGILRSAEQAATRLKTAYEIAIKQGTDRYAEVLWATANGQHFDRQFKDITDDYEKIMQKRPHRSGYDTAKNNASELRNALNSLVTRKHLQKGKSGWYSFSDPMFRSYVRLVAEKDGVELGQESFPA